MRVIQPAFRRKSIDASFWSTFVTTTSGANVTTVYTNMVTDNVVDTNSGVPTQRTRQDNSVAHQAVNDLGQITSQWGAGNTPASFGYDSNANFTDLTLYPSGTVSSSASDKQVTHWVIDPATNLASEKDYGYTGSGASPESEKYFYDSKGHTTAVQKLNKG